MVLFAKEKRHPSRPPPSRPSRPKCQSNLPDVQDRKRIVACLAVVLANIRYHDINMDDIQNASLSEEDYELLLSAGEENYYTPDKAATETVKTSTSETGLKQEELDEEKNKTKKELEEIVFKRARKRRYEFYTKLLKSSCTLLFLDKEYSAAFTPMLGRLLKPNIWPLQSRDSDLSTSDIESRQLQSKTSNINDSSTSGDGNSVEEEIARQLEPFLESLTIGQGFRCIALLLVHHLLLSPEGYDARVRHAFKRLAVAVLSHEASTTTTTIPSSDSAAAAAEAARRFASLEQAVAAKLLSVADTAAELVEEIRPDEIEDEDIAAVAQEEARARQENLVRQIKIGAVGIVAGTLFAVTGGLAAPGIAAGVTALVGSSAAATVAVAALANTFFVGTLFGVGGGGLAAYKMKRRTQGLTEFEFQQQTHSSDADINQQQRNPELFTVLCVSGWLKDGQRDFEQPWGINPSANGLEIDDIERLRRFFAIYDPKIVDVVKKVYESKKWKGKKEGLWKSLKKKYGRDPDHLYPIGENVHFLTCEENKIVDDLMEELGYPQPKKIIETASEMLKKENIELDLCDDILEKNLIETDVREHGPLQTGPDSNPVTDESNDVTKSSSVSESVVIKGESLSDPSKPKENQQKQQQVSFTLQTKPFVPWDFQTSYAGELYTIKWESEVLTDLTESVTKLAAKLAKDGAKEILKHTILATLMSAISLPNSVKKVADFIDGSWAIGVERAREAGVELAKCLLQANGGGAGLRPVTLMGFSFGARVIFECLKELARAQEAWERCLYSGSSGGKSTKVAVVGGVSMKLEREPASIIEDVILMGAPIPLDVRAWKACRGVIAGRFINCYSTRDLTLSLMFRYKQLESGDFTVWPFCGITPVVGVGGIQNFDVTENIGDHSDYCVSVNDILKVVRHGQTV